MDVFDLRASITLTEGAELYASLLELTELSKRHAELSRQIGELSEFIRKQVDVQMNSKDDDSCRK